MMAEGSRVKDADDADPEHGPESLGYERVEPRYRQFTARWQKTLYGPTWAPHTPASWTEFVESTLGLGSVGENVVDVP